jgi:retron-type reverse transcriptase
MRIDGEKIVFSPMDLRYLENTDIDEVLAKAEEFCSRFRHPFICDIYQLSGELDVSIEDLREVQDRSQTSYRRYYIKTRSGKFRKIEEPDYMLALVQRRILNRILRYYDISEHATAYHKGANVEGNAQPHVGKKYLLKMDLTDFFGHVTDSMLLRTAFSIEHFPFFIGKMLTDICTRDGAIPQGACTSPALSNIVMKEFDDRMGRWCRGNGVTYTRYSDDLTFSSDRPLYGTYLRACKLLGWMGFEVNEEKTHFITTANRQQVTGLVVNDKLNVPSDYRRKLRQEIYYVLRFGAEEAFSRCSERDVEPDMTLRRYLLRLIGKTDYVLQVRKDDSFFMDAKKRLEEEVAELDHPVISF